MPSNLREVAVVTPGVAIVMAHERGEVGVKEPRLPRGLTGCGYSPIDGPLASPTCRTMRSWVPFRRRPQAPARQLWRASGWVTTANAPSATGLNRYASLPESLNERLRLMLKRAGSVRRMDRFIDVKLAHPRSIAQTASLSSKIHGARKSAVDQRMSTLERLGRQSAQFGGDCLTFAGVVSTPAKPMRHRGRS